MSRAIVRFRSVPSSESGDGDVDDDLSLPLSACNCMRNSRRAVGKLVCSDRENGEAELEE